MASMPRPSQWHDQPITGAVLNSIKMNAVGFPVIEEAEEPLLRYQSSARNSFWANFLHYCQRHGVLDVMSLREQAENLPFFPPEIKKMLGDPEWTKKMKQHLANRRRDMAGGKGNNASLILTEAVAMA